MTIELRKSVWDQEGSWTTVKNEIYRDGLKVGEANIMVDSEDEDKIYLEDFNINKEFRNQGIGTEVLKMLAKEASDYLYMAPTDEDNQRLYARLGEELTTNDPEVDQGYGVYKIEA